MPQPRRLCLMLLLTSALLSTLPAFALPRLTVSSPDADGVFIVSGTDLDGVAGIYASISYDPSTLANPQVAMGTLMTGQLISANPGNPVRIAVVGTSGLRGSGTVATISFDRIGGSPGSITGVSATLIDMQSRTMAMAQPLVVNPFQPATPAVNSGGAGSGTDAATTPPTPPAVAAAATGRVPVVGGTVTMPESDQLPRKLDPGEAKPAPAQQEGERQVPPPEEAAPVPDPPPPGTPDQVAEQGAPPPQPVPSVLERFRLCEGEKTAATLISFFNRDGTAAFSQSPPIAISDGAATVKFSISNVAGEKAPKFTFSNAKFVSLHHGGNGEWEVEVRPEQGAVEATVTMLLNGTQQSYPVVVTPKVEIAFGKSAQATEDHFLLFLKNPFDLNGDGKRDYLDDYIYTANYLLLKGR